VRSKPTAAVSALSRTCSSSTNRKRCARRLQAGSDGARHHVVYAWSLPKPRRGSTIPYFGSISGSVDLSVAPSRDLDLLQQVAELAPWVHRILMSGSVSHDSSSSPDHGQSGRHSPEALDRVELCWHRCLSDALKSNGAESVRYRFSKGRAPVEVLGARLHSEDCAA